MTDLSRQGMTAAELRLEVSKLYGRSQASKKGRRNKFNAIRTIVDGLKFDSRKEAECWQFLKARLRAGEIQNLERQVRYQLTAFSEAGPVDLCAYVADFRYFDVKKNQTVVADAKGVKTALFKLKAKLMLANHGISIELM